MIFKSLFAPKWRHKNAAIRRAALTNLSIDTDKDAILDLAHNDPDISIRKAALEKINALDLWQAVSLDDQDAQVRKYASNKLKSFLLDDNNELCSEQAKLALIQQYANNPFLESLLAHTQNTEIRIALLQRVVKRKLDLELSLKSVELSECQLVYPRLNQYDETITHKELERLATKAKHEWVRTQAQADLAERIEKEEKPILAGKHLNLILSKLLSLKDKTDYGVIKEQGEQLVEQWNQSSEWLDCLDETTKAQFQQKYVDICNKLESSTQILKEAWYQQQQEKQQQAELEQLVRDVKQDIAHIGDTVEQVITGESAVDSNQLLDKIHDCRHKLTVSHFVNAQIEALHKELNTLETNANKLPEFAEQMSQVTRLISQLAQHHVPESLDELDEKAQWFAQWQNDWRALKKQLLLPLPVSLLDSQKQVNRQWQQAIDGLQSEQSKIVGRIHGKLKELNRLIQSGKYNAAFGLFRKVSTWHDELTLANQAKVQREFDKLTDKINDLADWKEYIAIPRKQELLTEVQTLVESPNDDPIKQAEKIRQLRHTWLMLGTIESADDQALNKAFDEATELAFAPCREYYAQQEQLREENLKLKTAIIDELSVLTQALAAQEKSISEISKSLSSIQSRWSKIGHVNRDAFKTVNNQFYDLLKPLKEQANEYYRANEKAKNKLISKAEECLASVTENESSNDAYSDAIEQLKALQASWKTIGFAGAGKDRKLWQSFRSINDKVFALRTEHAQKEKQARNTVFDKVLEKINAVQSTLSQADNFEAIKNIQTAVADIVINADLLTSGQVTKLEQLKETVKSDLDTLIAKINKDKQKANYLNLLAAIKQAPSEELNSRVKWASELETYQQVPPKEQQDTTQLDITIKLEILAGVETPERDKSRRMELQIDMLSSKLNAGDISQKDVLIGQWLQLGPPADKTLVDRLEAAIL
ncbi:hypothetical protein C2869_15105 [Saccharobesus litoralis]|uniref:DUF349 domain-containing protein n=1 Tax=Saccharobesus litoralis TaxID=2172099 RepID=A0A2S0VTY5_9ALTE|nr:DUF349 domain-containing protein [Saccharobesus litoralis]AWB67684.1 hypothetical protein C2869_15105 [Saccharobesus litoralis]